MDNWMQIAIELDFPSTESPFPVRQRFQLGLGESGLLVGLPLCMAFREL
jgi:hypothetical protein